MVRTNHAAVINVDPAGGQYLINWKTARVIRSRAMVDAVCDFAHTWCIYISALCIDQAGQRYIKSIEVTPRGLYLASQLTDVIEACYREHLEGCNPNHLAGSAWIAIPNDVSLDPLHVDHLYDSVGAWPAKAVA
jgi:hypothetical protein